MTENEKRDLLREVQDIRSAYQGVRASLQDSLQKMLDDISIQQQLFAIERRLCSQMLPGIRISDSQIVLPGDAVNYTYKDTRTTVGLVATTEVSIDGEPAIYLLLPGEAWPMWIHRGQFDRLEVLDWEQRAIFTTYKPCLGPEKKAEDEVRVGDRVNDGGFGGYGPGVVVYIVELPEPGLLIKFDKQEYGDSPTFIPDSGLEQVFHEIEGALLEPTTGDSHIPSFKVDGGLVADGDRFQQLSTGELGTVTFTASPEGEEVARFVRLKFDDGRVKPLTIANVKDFSFLPSTLVSPGPTVPTTSDGQFKVGDRVRWTHGRTGGTVVAISQANEVYPESMQIAFGSGKAVVPVDHFHKVVKIYTPQ